MIKQGTKPPPLPINFLKLETDISAQNLRRKNLYWHLNQTGHPTTTNNTPPHPTTNKLFQAGNKEISALYQLKNTTGCPNKSVPVASFCYSELLAHFYWEPCIIKHSTTNTPPTSWKQGVSWCHDLSNVEWPNNQWPMSWTFYSSQHPLSWSWILK